MYEVTTINGYEVALETQRTDDRRNKIYTQCVTIWIKGLPDYDQSGTYAALKETGWGTADWPYTSGGRQLKLTRRWHAVKPSLIVDPLWAAQTVKNSGWIERAIEVVEVAAEALTLEKRKDELRRVAEALGENLGKQAREQAAKAVRWEQRLTALKAEMQAEMAVQAEEVKSEWGRERDDDGFLRYADGSIIPEPALQAAIKNSDKFLRLPYTGGLRCPSYDHILTTEDIEL